MLGRTRDSAHTFQFRMHTHTQTHINTHVHEQWSEGKRERAEDANSQPRRGKQNKYNKKMR